jgi:ubiquinone/menaquinone biosynthesis C-methylase UbiE
MGNSQTEVQRRSLAGRILTRRTTNALRAMLDNWLPPVLRESRPFAWAVRVWLGPNALPDFKYRAFRMSPAEFSDANERVAGKYSQRQTDTTPGQADWLVANLGPAPVKVLEIGPGNGTLTERLRKAGHDVWIVDIYPRENDDHYVHGTVDHIQLADKSVDVIVLAHVIEHVQSLTRAFLELERVARDRVLIVTPKQRFFRWTFDYHLHFFYSVDHLASHINRGNATGVEINGDLCLFWDVRPSA